MRMRKHIEARARIKFHRAKMIEEHERPNRSMRVKRQDTPDDEIASEIMHSGLNDAGYLHGASLLHEVSNFRSNEATCPEE
jgi:hypothetical protein